MPRGIFPRTEEYRAKLSKALMNNTNALGHRLSEEDKAKLSKARMGNTYALGKVAWNKGKSFSKESKSKMSLAHKGHHCSEEQRAKISLAMKGKQNTLGYHPTKETRAKIGLAQIGNKNTLGSHCSKETKIKIGEALKGREISEKTKAKLRKARLLWWANCLDRDKHIKAVLLGLRIRPTKPELKLQILLNNLYPNEWKYTGDGGIIIGGRVPDFTNVNGKKEVMELYGNYWHKGQNPQDKIGHYKRYGFRCLVIWEEELKNPNKVSARIVGFRSQ